MALAELLRALETDADARITQVREAAAADSARLQAEGRERLERRRSADLATREAGLEAEALRELEAVRLEGVGRVLTARARALEQIRGLASSRLLEAAPDASLSAGIAEEVGRALNYFGQSAAVLRCAPRWRAAFEPLLDGRKQLSLEIVKGAAPGAALRAADGSLEIDATLEARLDRLWPALSIQLVRTLEANR